MPKPIAGEDKNMFIERFMDSDEAELKYPDEGQRIKVAYQYWDEFKKETVNKSVYNKAYAEQSFEDQYEQSTITYDTPSGVAKTKDDEQLVFGWANVAIKADGSLPFDWQGDIKDSSVLEKAAYDFVLKYRVANEVHEQNDEIRGDLIESIMFTKEKMAAMGIPEGSVPEGWWVGFHIRDPEVFQKVKSGVYKMFSIEGRANRIPIK